MVDYDSIIPPGRTGKITPFIKAKKLRSGTFTKSIKIMSNATNTPTLRLSISGKVLSDINLSKRFLRLQPDHDGKAALSLTLKTEKPDFKIKDIAFRENKRNDPNWESKSGLTVTHHITRSDSTDIDKYYTYTLSLFLTIAPTKMLSGSFEIETNHEKKDHLSIRGMIDKIKEQPKSD